MRSSSKYSTHSDPLECNAFNYIVHTLDGTASLLNNPKYFPSRLKVPDGSAQHLQNISRRMYRIFAHVHFHHEEAYSKIKELHKTFVKLCKENDLVNAESLIIPGDAT